MPDCLLLTADADRFAAEIDRIADFSVRLSACVSPGQALDEYRGQTVILGEPGMIATVLDYMPKVEWVQSMWAGVTPLVSSARRDYVLTGVKGIFGPQMSEYVLGYLLAHELRVIERASAQLRHDWTAVPSRVLQGRCLGIMGTGSIGQHIAKTAAGFGVSVTGLSRSGAAVPGFEAVLPVEHLYEFLEDVDYLVSTLPQTDATNNLLDAAALAKLPPHAYFINVGRSNVINDAALIDALRNGGIAGAALDVFDEEPLPNDSPLWDTPNLSITAHIAAISHPDLITPIFIDNYRRYVQGQPLRYVVDFDAGY